MKKVIITFVILLLSLLNNSAQEVIKMEEMGGVFTAQCTVNGLKLRFIFDTGASNVSISLSEAIFMLKNGYLDENDLHGSSYSQLANGEFVENTTINIKELEIGRIRLQNVEAIVIHELSAPLLLGQSAIKRLGPIQINNNELVILNAAPASSERPVNDAVALKNKAIKYREDRLYHLAAEAYENAYYIDPKGFDCEYLYLMGNSFYNIDDYSKSIKYLEKATDCKTDDKQLKMLVHEFLGLSYFGTENFEKAIINYQHALTYSKENVDFSLLLHLLGWVYSEQNKYHEAIQYYEKSVNYRLKHLSANNNDLMRGKIRDGSLGEIYWNIALNFNWLKENTERDKNLIKSALCGFEPAIEFCKEFGLKYELYIE